MKKVIINYWGAICLAIGIAASAEGVSANPGACVIDVTEYGADASGKKTVQKQ